MLKYGILKIDGKEKRVQIEKIICKASGEQHITVRVLSDRVTPIEDLTKKLSETIDEAIMNGVDDEERWRMELEYDALMHRRY